MAADTFLQIPCGRKSGVRDDDLAVFDPDQIDARSALTAFLAGRTALLELDHAVHAGQLDLPERLTDGVGLRLAGLLDRRRDGADAVVAAEALRQTRERVPTLLPLLDETFSHLGISRNVRVPRREERDVGRVVRRRARLLDELIGTLRAAGGDDPLLQPERRRL